MCRAFPGRFYTLKGRARRAAYEQKNHRGASDRLDLPDLAAVHRDRRMDRHPDQGIPETSRRPGCVRRDQHRCDSRLFHPRFGPDVRLCRFAKRAERRYGTIGKIRWPDRQGPRRSSRGMTAMHDRKSSRIAACTFGAPCVLAAALLFVWGCGKKESGPTERTIAKSEPPAYKPYLNSDLVQGREVFEAKHCDQCHSIFERERKIGPKLQSTPFYGSFLDRFLRRLY